MYKLSVCFIIASTVLVESAPGGYVAGGGEAAIGGDVPSLFTFENGNIGVNFLGFKASAGLGGLLSGHHGAGGLHAEAETPFGQAAKAGLGGNISGKGRSVGGLYADATAGGGVAAGAGLAGIAGNQESYGMSYAGSSVGGVYKGKTKVKAVVPVEKEVAPVRIVEEHTEVKPQKTYIERTVIPNYEEKTIFVPSYVEKTIRVPTVVEKKVKVPAPPTVIEKAVDAPADVNFETSKIHVVEQAPVTHIHKIHSRPFFKKHFFVGGGYGAGFAGEGNGASYGAGDISGTKTITVQKSADTEVIDKIFKVPISTLGAVDELVKSIVGGTSGSFHASKSVSF